MGVIKNHIREQFTQIPNAVITDNNLSPLSLRVLLYLYSKPTNWNVNNNDIRKKLKIKDPRTIAKCWKELIKSGWVQRTKQRKEDGNLTGCYDYHIFYENTHTKKDQKAEEKQKETAQDTECAKNAHSDSDSPNVHSIPMCISSQCAKNAHYNNTDYSNNTNSFNNKECEKDNTHTKTKKEQENKEKKAISLKAEKKEEKNNSPQPPFDKKSGKPSGFEEAIVSRVTVEERRQKNLSDWQELLLCESAYLQSISLGKSWDQQTTIRMLDTFTKQQILLQKNHTGYNDYRSHFFHWTQKRVTDEKPKTRKGTGITSEVAWQAITELEEEGL